LPDSEDEPATHAAEEQALEQITHPDAEEAPSKSVSAVESVLGREQLIRFRARYAELQARIIERAGDPARLETMRGQAEALDPDSWVTADEARKGLEVFELKVRELRAALGLKRRRRSRRGGRRRQGAPAASPVGASNPVAGDITVTDHEDQQEDEDDDGGGNV
jgi:hypothetical protein